ELNWSARSLQRSHRLLEVADQVVGALEADREPEQIRRARRARPFHAGAMLQEAFDAAERGGALPDLDVGGGGDGGRFAALDAHGEHAAEAAVHLAGGGGMLSVRVKGGE